MSYSEEITRRLTVLKQSAQDFVQMVGLIDSNFDLKTSEIKVLEEKSRKLREECDLAQKKAQVIVQEASDKASVIAKEASRLLNEAQSQRSIAKDELEMALKSKAEAKALYDQAIQRQKEADVQFRMNEDKKRKLEEAMR